MRRVRVKICCIASPDEAAIAVECGADAIGLVGEMPSGPGVIDDESARRIALAVPPGVDSFLLTSRSDGDDIADHVEFCGVTTVQVVRHVEHEEHRRIAARLPHVRRVQVVHVEDESALDLVDVYEPWVHAFLLDSGRPKARVAELGGTGRVHDWGVSAAFVKRTMRPVFLAGGLAPENAAAAAGEVAPYGLDICSGVRTDGALDRELLEQFMRQVRG